MNIGGNKIPIIKEVVGFANNVIPNLIRKPSSQAEQADPNPLVRCMKCRKVMPSAEALEHIKRTGHNSWELLPIKKKGVKSKENANKG